MKIYVAGHTGLLGQSLLKKLCLNKSITLILKTRKELDLLNQKDTFDFISISKPDLVILLAAKVGGIVGNQTFPADYILENIQIQTNIISACNKNNIQNLIFLGSSCIYPKESIQPIKPEYLLTSPLEISNENYALAKISGVFLCKSMRKQYKRNYISLMPCNLYGENDRYHDIENSHVIPAIITKIKKAKLENRNVELYGTGSALREFLHGDDLADFISIIIPIMLKTELPDIINIGNTTEISIKDLTIMISDLLDFKNDIIWDKNFPDGTLRKKLDTSFINQTLNWYPKIELRDGLKKIIDLL